MTAEHAYTWLLNQPQNRCIVNSRDFDRDEKTLVRQGLAVVETDRFGMVWLRARFFTGVRLLHADQLKAARREAHRDIR